MTNAATPVGVNAGGDVRDVPLSTNEMLLMKYNIICSKIRDNMSRQNKYCEDLGILDVMSRIGGLMRRRDHPQGRCSSPRVLSTSGRMQCVRGLLEKLRQDAITLNCQMVHNISQRMALLTL